jgi:type IV pilus assembly protein PilW
MDLASITEIRPAALRHVRGFSIVELLVAMALSLLLLAGVIAIFSSSRVSYETTDKLSRIQENGRFALDQLTRDIRSAGFVGCSRSPTYLSTSLNNAGNLQWNFLDGPVRGFQYTGPATWSPAIDASVLNPADGSDVLVLRLPEREAQPLRLRQDMASSTSSLVIPNTSAGLSVNDVALAYSCEGQAYFQVRSIAAGPIAGTVALTHEVGGGTTTKPGNAVADISYVFRTNAEVIPVETIIYYISASTAGPAGSTSLWRRIGLNTTEELVEGIERLELAFGVDTTGDAVVDNYVTAAGVTNWDSVFSVTVALLVRSLEEYGPDTDQRTYQLLQGANLVTIATPADRRMREVFTATAGVRNRMPVE